MSTNNNQIKTILRDRVNPKSTGGWYKLIKGIQSDGVAYIDTLVYVHAKYHRQIIDLYHYPINTEIRSYAFCGYGSTAISSGRHGCWTSCWMTGYAHPIAPDILMGPTGPNGYNSIFANRPWYNRHVILTEGSSIEYAGNAWISLYDVEQGLFYYPEIWTDSSTKTGVSLGTSKLFCRGTGAITIDPIDPLIVFYEYQLFNGTTAETAMTEKLHFFPCILTQNIDGSLDSKGVARLKGTVGMYDSVSGKFFANAASSGQFIAVLS